MANIQTPTLVEVTLKSASNSQLATCATNKTFTFYGYDGDEPCITVGNIREIIKDMKECKFDARRKDYYQYIATKIRHNKSFDGTLIEHILYACDKFYNAEFDCSLKEYEIGAGGLPCPEFTHSNEKSFYPMFFRFIFEGGVRDGVEQFVITMEPYWGYWDEWMDVDHGEDGGEFAKNCEKVLKDFDRLIGRSRGISLAHF